MRTRVPKKLGLLLCLVIYCSVTSSVSAASCVNGFCSSQPSGGHGAINHEINKLKSYVRTGKLYVQSFRANMTLYRSILNDLRSIKNSSGCTGSTWASSRQLICTQKYDAKISKLAGIARRLDVLEGKTKVIKQKMKDAVELIDANVDLNDVDKTIAQLNQQISASEAMNRSLERAEGS